MLWRAARCGSSRGWGCCQKERVLSPLAASSPFPPLSGCTIQDWQEAAPQTGRPWCSCQAPLWFSSHSLSGSAPGWCSSYCLKSSSISLFPSAPRSVLTSPPGDLSITSSLANPYLPSHYTRVRPILSQRYTFVLFLTSLWGSPRGHTNTCSNYRYLKIKGSFSSPKGGLQGMVWQISPEVLSKAQWDEVNILRR